MRTVPWAVVFSIYMTAIVAGSVFLISSVLTLDRGLLVIAITAISFLSGVLAMWFSYIRRSLPSDYRSSPSEFQIVTLWRQPLGKLQRVIDLSSERISLVQKELREALQDGISPIFALIGIGYKAVQTCNAIHMLCARGYPDQALSLCRGLVEQEANLRFILIVENKAQVTERYLDWEKAKDIVRWKTRNEGKLNSTNEEWGALTKVYEQLEAKYRGNGKLRDHEQWAIGTRSNGVDQIEAFSPEARAKHFIRLLASDEARLRDTWTVRWQRLNEFTHATPRSIIQSAASNDPSLVVTTPSHLGIDEPLVIAGQTMLNISSLLAQIVTDEFAISENLGIKDLWEESQKAFYCMLKEVEEVPGTLPTWYAVVQLHHKESSKSL